MTNEPVIAQDLARGGLTTKWGILPGNLPDPDETPSLDKLFPEPTDAEIASLMWQSPEARHFQAIDAFQPTFSHREINANQVAGILYLMYFPEENYEHPSYTALDMRWSKKDLMEAFEDSVDNYLRSRRKTGFKQAVPQTRRRLDQYVKYLRAYDLRLLKQSYKKIDLLLFPRLGGDEKRGALYCRKGESFVANPPRLPVRIGRKGDNA